MPQNLLNPKKLALFTLFAFAIFATSAFAQSEEEEEIPGVKKWALHVGSIFMSRPEFIGSDNNQFRVFPFIQALYRFDDKNEIYLRGIQSGYNHKFNKTYKAGVEFTSRRGRNANEDARLAGMPDIGRAWEVGPWVQYRTGDLRLKATARIDVSGEHDGYSIDLQAKQKFHIKPGVSFDGYVQTSWGDDNFVDHYFGVTAAQALATRPAINPDAGFYQSALGGSFTYGLRKQVFLKADARMNVFMGDANDSALTFGSTNFSGYLGIGYTF